MRTALRLFRWALLLIALAMVGVAWRKISILQSENDGLKAALQAREAAAHKDQDASKAREIELARRADQRQHDEPRRFHI